LSLACADYPKRILFLSGGLGGSTYVNAQIQAYYQNHPHINAPGLIILRSQEPQLAVVKGLVMDRRQKLLSGAAALKTRMLVSLFLQEGYMLRSKERELVTALFVVSSTTRISMPEKK
jgi:hypothetical protein